MLVKDRRCFVIFNIVTIAIQMVHFGYCLTIFSPLIPSYIEKYQWDQDGSTQIYVTIISSVASLGAVIGFFFVKLIMRIGRTRALHLINLLLIISYSLSLIDNIPILIIAKFLQGFTTGGLTCTIVPQYIYETSPMALRGKLGALSQICLNFGILLCFILGLGVPSSKEEMHTSQYWRFMYFFPVAICIL